MELDLEPKTLLVAGAMFTFCLLVLWKFEFMEQGWSIPMKIALSIFALPICYFMTTMQLNR